MANVRQGSYGKVYPNYGRIMRSPWTLHDVLGQGSYGKVYHAHHSGTGQIAALKQLCLRRVKAENRERSVRDEIATLQRIAESYENGHPNILRLFEHFRTSSSIFIVTELCAGGDVAELVKRCQGRPMAPVIVRGLVKQLAAGLQVLRAQNLVHRDLKPANLLLTHHDPRDPGCTLKIADFGFSRTLAAGDLAATLVGSPLYVAPELLAFKSYDEKADLWSVGCILVEMLSGGIHPFRSWRGRDATNQIALRGNIQAYFKHYAALDVPPTGYCALGEATSEHGPLSADTVSLLQALLRPDPGERASFAEFFNHPALLPPPPGDAADGNSALPASSAASPAEPAGSASEEGDGTAAAAGAVPAVASAGSVEPAASFTDESAQQSAEVAALCAENDHLRASLLRAESEHATATAHSVALDLESQVCDAEVEWNCPDIAVTQDLTGMSYSAMGMALSSDGGIGPVGTLALLPNDTATSFEAFSDPAVAPCSLNAQCAAAVPVGAAFVLGRVTALEPEHEDGSGEMVATIEQLHFDGACSGTKAQATVEASVPPDDRALGSAISFRRLGIGRIVLFFHTGVGEQYVAFNQGQSNWYLAQESVTSASRRAREERAEAGGSNRGSDLPGFVYGEVVMVTAQVASAELNPYQLPEGVCYNEVTVALLGVAPI